MALENKRVFLPCVLGDELDNLEVYGPLVRLVTTVDTSLKADMDVIRRGMMGFTSSDYLAMTGPGVYDAMAFAWALKVTGGSVTVLVASATTHAMEAVTITDFYQLGMN